MTTRTAPRLVDYLAATVAIGLILGVAWSWQRARCSTRWAILGIEARWTIREGCQVKLEQQWAPEDSVEATKEPTP
jgi:hypothetical protein